MAIEDPGSLLPTGGGLHLYTKAHREEEQKLIGTTIKGYRITGLLGRGGMGVVFRAQALEPHLQREVAIKLIATDLQAASLVERFGREISIHSRLEHSNIARLYDAGIRDAGGSYLIMECVDGIPIDQYCLQNSRSQRARLQLFKAVCEAVAYAHGNLVVHRDLKPSNVLIDDNGHAKLLDFGVAKLLDHGDSELTLDMRVFTPGYASPEQIRGEAITTASDTFQLGALLYIVLTGQPLFGTGSTESAFRRAHETFEAKLPESETVDLPRELKAIVLKCVATLPAERYASVDALIDDLSRYLDHYPVTARQPGPWQFAVKFVRRNRLLTGLVVGGLALAILGNGLYLTALRSSQQAATAQATKATAVTRFLIDLFNQADRDQSNGQFPSLDELLARGTARIDQELADQPLVQADLKEALGRIYLAAGRYSESRNLLESAIETKQKLLSETDPSLGLLHWYLGRLHFKLPDGHQAASDHWRTAISLRQQHYGKDTYYALMLADLADYEIVRTQDYDRAITLLDEALSIQDSVAVADQGQQSRTLRLLMLAHERKANYLDAQEFGERSVAIAIEHYGADHAKLIDPLFGLARVHESQGQYEIAQDFFKQALTVSASVYSENHELTANILLNLAHTQRLNGDLEQALHHADRAVVAMQQIFGEKGTDIGVALCVAAQVYQEIGNYAQAGQYLKLAMALYEDEFGKEHTHTAYAALINGNYYKEIGDYQQALTHYGWAYENWRNAHGEAHPDAAKVQLELAHTHLWLGELERAEDNLVPAMRSNQGVLSPDHDRIAQGLTLLGRLEAAKTPAGDCMAPLQQALASRLDKLAGGHRKVLRTKLELMNCFLVKGDRPRAQELASELRRLPVGGNALAPVTEQRRIELLARIN